MKNLGPPEDAVAAALVESESLQTIASLRCCKLL